jgi:hypothetical protein
MNDDERPELMRLRTMAPELKGARCARSREAEELARAIQGNLGRNLINPARTLEERSCPAVDRSTAVSPSSACYVGANSPVLEHGRLAQRLNRPGGVSGYPCGELADPLLDRLLHGRRPQNGGPVLVSVEYTITADEEPGIFSSSLATEPWDMESARRPGKDRPR